MALTDQQRAEFERDYALEKLTNALHLRVTGRGDVRERVADAFFACHTLRERIFPQELRGDWRWITGSDQARPIGRWRRGVRK